MKKRIFSRAIALFMALSLLSTTAFAASFTQLQGAIDDTGNAAGQDLGNGRFGYGEMNQETQKYGIEAWTDTTTNDDGTTTATRNVQLNENVIHQESGDTPFIDFRTTPESGSLVLDLNNYAIDGNKNNTKPGETPVIVAAGTATIKNGTITGSLGSGILSHEAYTDKRAVNLTLENVNVTGNAGRGISLGTCNEGSSFTMKGGSAQNNGAQGVFLQDLTFSIEDAVISGNGKNNSGTNVSGLHLGNPTAGTVSNTEIYGNVGRGIFMASGTTATLDKVNIHDNAGGIITGNANLTISNSTIINNHAPETNENSWAQAVEGGGIKIGGTLNLGDGNIIHSNTSSAGASDIYATDTATINGLDKTLNAPNGKQFDGWYEGNEKYATDGQTGTVVNLVARLSDAPVTTPTTPTDVITPVVDAVDAAAFAGSADAAATIADNEVPLAGLITRAQLVSYLYEHEGSPDGADAEGEYTLALAWAVANEIVDEEDDPDEIVTVAILRDVMTNYAAYLDTTFDVVIEDEDDMIVMNCGEILAEFFASLEGKAA